MPKILSLPRMAALAALLLAALCSGAAGRVVTEAPARTEELFHTPYRQEDSRHFKVCGDLVRLARRTLAPPAPRLACDCCRRARTAPPPNRRAHPHDTVACA